MTGRTKIFLIGTVLISFILLVSVPICDFILSFIFDSSNQNQSETAKQIMAGIISETTRAAITCYLYSVTENKGSNLIHGVKHGLLYSALIGSLYLILGYFYFQLKSPLLFLISDTFILTIQGIASGTVLYYVFRKKQH